MHLRRKWQPTPVFFPGESQGWGSLVGCRLWGRTESDTTEVTQQQMNDDGFFQVIWCDISDPSAVFVAVCFLMMDLLDW